MNSQRIVCLASSCLEVAGIPHEVSDQSIIADHFNGHKVTLEVDPKIFDSQDGSIVREGVKEICVNLGYPPKDVIPRPKMSKNRIKKSEATIETVLREKRFAWMPNPPDEVFTTYKGVVKLAAAKFCRSNYLLLQKTGYTQEDIISYCQLFLVGFWATDRVFSFKSPKKDDNFRLCYGYLRQKLAELYSKINKQQRGYDIGDIDISAENVIVHTSPQNKNDTAMYVVDHSNEMMEDTTFVNFENILNEIQALEHDVFLEALETLGSSRFSEQAKAAMIDHRIKCKTCKARVQWKSYREKYRIQKEFNLPNNNPAL